MLLHYENFTNWLIYISYDVKEMRQPAIWLSWSLEELHFSNMDTPHVFHSNQGKGSFRVQVSFQWGYGKRFTDIPFATK